MSIPPTARQWAIESLERDAALAANQAERERFKAQLEADVAAKLADFDAATADLERQATKSCDETLFVRLSAKQQMRPHLEAKLKAEAESKLAGFKPRQQPPEVKADYDLVRFVADCEQELRAAFRRCFKAEYSADRCFNDSDAGSWFLRFRRFGISADDRAATLRALADGKPANLPWIFAP